MKKSFFGDTLSVTISKVIVSLIAIFSAMLLSRFRTLEEYGTYSELLVMSNLVSTIIFLGVPNSVNFFLPRCATSKDCKEFLSTYYGAVFFMGLVSGLLLLSSIPLWEVYFDDSNIGGYWYFLLLFPLTKILIIGADNQLIVFRKTNVLVGYRILHSMMQISIIIAIQLMNLTFGFYLICYIACEVLFSIFIIGYVSRLCGILNFRIDKELIKQILRFSLPLGLASAAGVINIEMDKLVIGHFLSTEELAIYTNASREIPISMITSSFTIVLMPKVSKMIKEKEYKKACSLWQYVTQFSYCIIIFFACFFATFSKETLDFLYSGKYTEGYLVFSIYAGALILQSTYFGLFLNVSGNTKYIFRGAVTSMLLNVVLNILMFKGLGFFGPALATAICTLYLIIYQIYMTKKKIGVNFFIGMRPEYILRPLIALVPLVIISNALRGYIKGFARSNFVFLLLLGGVWLLIYGIVMFKQMKTLIFLMNADAD